MNEYYRILSAICKLRIGATELDRRNLLSFIVCCVVVQSTKILLNELPQNVA